MDNLWITVEHSVEHILLKRLKKAKKSLFRPPPYPPANLLGGGTEQNRNPGGKKTAAGKQHPHPPPAAQACGGPGTGAGPRAIATPRQDARQNQARPRRLRGQDNTTTRQHARGGTATQCQEIPLRPAGRLAVFVRFFCGQPVEKLGKNWGFFFAFAQIGFFCSCAFASFL